MERDKWSASEESDESSTSESSKERTNKLSSPDFLRRILQRPPEVAPDRPATPERPIGQPLMPVPLEKILISKNNEEDNTSEEDEDEDEKESKVVDDQLQPESQQAGSAAVEAEAETVVGESVQAQSMEESAPVTEVAPDTQENHATESELKTEVFETITGSAPAQETAESTTESTGLPQLDIDKPTIDLTPEENKAFKEIADQLRPEMEQSIKEIENEKDIPPIPSWNMPEVGSPFDPGPGEQQTSGRFAAITTARGAPVGGPPPAPNHFEAANHAGAGSAMVPGGGEASSAYRFNSSPYVQTVSAAETAANTTRTLANVLTAVAVMGYLAHVRRERKLTRELKEQRKQISELQDQQRLTNEQLRQLSQKQAEQAAAQVEGEQEIFDENGNRIILQPGWRIERSAGGYSVVVDKHNRVVHDAIRYKDEFKREQQREQLSDDAFAAFPGGGQAGSPQDSGIMPPFPPVAGTGQGTSSGQQPLLNQSDQVDLNHRLTAPRRTIREAALNPWLWTAVAVLIIIYFAASLA